MFLSTTSPKEWTTTTNLSPSSGFLLQIVQSRSMGHPGRDTDCSSWCLVKHLIIIPIRPLPLSYRQSEASSSGEFRRKQLEICLPLLGQLHKSTTLSRTYPRCGPFNRDLLNDDDDQRGRRTIACFMWAKSKCH